MPLRFISRSHSLRPPAPKGGFALLITITLLAFLVLLLVSLASLTRVETQVAGNNQQLSQARQNAFTALGLALGRLQKAAGPDQRTSAQADLLNPASGAPVISTGSSRWTGVWGNTQASSAYSQTPAVIDWLVSGNENTAFTADETASANFGKITASPAPAYKPDNTVNNLTISSLPTDTTLTIAGQPVRLLVGPGTVGTDPANLDKFVVAPLRNIEVPASTIPGLTGSTATVIGRYAYWIGDEGVKTRINRIDPYAASPTADQSRYRYLAAQRSATELIDDDNNTANTSAVATAFPTDPNDPSIARLLAGNQLTLLSTTAAAQTTLQNTQRNRFHELTTATFGVLADQVRGGLRRDLTAAFAHNNPAAANILPTGTTLQDFLNTRIFAPATANAYDFGGVTWSRLRDYYRFNSAGAASVAPQSPSSANALPLSPVLSVAQIYLGGSMQPDTNLANPNNVTVTYYLTPVVVLWNPYNVTLRAADYRVTSIGDGNADPSFRRNVKASVIVQYKDPSNVYWPDSTNLQGTGNRPKRFSLYHVGLNLTGGVDIPPGKAVVYTMKADAALGDIYASPIELTLTPGWFSGGQVRYGTYTTPSFLLGGGITGATAGAATQLSLRFGDTSASSSTGFDGWSFILTDTSSNVLQAVSGIYGSVNSASNASPTEVRIDNWTANPATIDSPKAGFKYVLNTTDNGNASSSIVTAGRRWLADYNPRSYLSGRGPQDTPASGNTGFNNNPAYSALIGGLGNTSIASFFDAGLSGNVTVGYSSDSSSGGSTAILFALPTEPAPGNDFAARFLSLGALRMADFYRYDGRVTLPNATTLAATTGVGSPYPASGTTFPVNADNSETWNNANYSPAYPFGASLANPRISPDQVVRSYTTADTRRSGYISYDTSYLLNRSIWDGYFLSTVSQVAAPDFATPGFNLPNSRLRPYSSNSSAAPVAANLQSFDKAAANLLVEGAFNVNSTSVNAWTALLASLRNVPVAAFTDADHTFVPRLASPANAPFNSASQQADAEAAYTGFRSLSDAQIRSLATKLVAEIRARGPFLSLSHFINRSLVTNDYRGLKGALQSAIDATDINQALLTPTKTAANFDLSAAITGSNPYTRTGGGFNNTTNPTFYIYGTNNTAGRIVGFQDRGSQTAAAAPDANSAGGATYAHSAPGFLTQGDLLTSLAPLLSARSDTFRIRIYAESVNPLDPAVVLGRAWCEALVQRTPDYVDTADLPETRPADLTSAANKTFGRKFKIVSLRWLSPSDI